jgi:hypothetical protein
MNAVEKIVRRFAKLGIYIPRPIWDQPDRTLRDLIKQSLFFKDEYGRTVTHFVCANRDLLRRVGGTVLSTEALSLRTDSGRTPAHIAAMYGNLSLVSPKLLTPAVLDQFDDDGCTVIHFAAEFNSIDTIPPNVLTFRNFFQLPNAYGLTAYDLLVRDDFGYFYEIRWDEMKCRSWIDGLESLRAFQSHLPANTWSTRFKTFVRRIEEFRCLKTEEAITLE